MFRAIALIAVFLCLSFSVACDGFEAGTGKTVITPDPLLPISGGMGPSAPASGKQGDLFARAVVFRHENETVAIVSLDLLGFPSVLGDRVRKLVPEINGRSIIIGVTHTHSAPDCYAFPDGKGGHTGNLEYMQFVCEQTAKAIRQALDDLRPAHIRTATGEVQGKVAFNYYAPDLYDRRAHILQAIDPNGQALVTLVNYAAHPEVLGADSGICSPDLVGPMCDRIESTVGGMALFMNSAQGGMITADNRDLTKMPRDAQRGYWEGIGTWEECQRIGHTLADEALRIIQPAQSQDSPRLVCVNKRVTFPVESDDLWAVVNYSPLDYPKNKDRSITTTINLLHIGDAQILTIPGEAMPNIGFYLKRKMTGRHNFLFGLTNDAFGYILTKVDYNSFPRYDYVSRVSLGEMTGEILIENALQMIDESPAK
ncbi:MAG: hypothetical protein R3C28_15265 [Pirellulaceae bacterium]